MVYLAPLGLPAGGAWWGWRAVPRLGVLSTGGGFPPWCPPHTVCRWGGRQRGFLDQAAYVAGAPMMDQLTPLKPFGGKRSLTPVRKESVSPDAGFWWDSLVLPFA